MDGVINVLKPAGMTSHDVVNKLRKIYKTKKVGHTGTLDPDAVGVLPVCIGQATRLVEYLMEKDKTYRVIMKFGSETNTQDGSGEITKTTDICSLDREAFWEVVQGFIGEIQQVPPMYSAIKKDGQPLYKLARQGIEIEVEPRKVTIHHIELLMYNQESAMLNVVCSKGTYIRTLCQDIGRACQSSAHMTFLMRTQSGQYVIDDGITLEKLAEASDPTEFLTPLSHCLTDMPKLVLTDSIEIKRLMNGMTLKTALHHDGLHQAITADKQLLAIGVVEQGFFKPHKVFKCGE